jgi:hypothetical protein
MAHDTELVSNVSMTIGLRLTGRTGQGEQFSLDLKYNPSGRYVYAELSFFGKDYRPITVVRYSSETGNTITYPGYNPEEYESIRRMESELGGLCHALINGPLSPCIREIDRRYETVTNELPELDEESVKDLLKSFGFDR